jgi:hypothetical protein
MLRKNIQFLLLVLWLTLLPMTASAQANAILPYSMVNSYLDLFKSLEHLDKIISSIVIVSTNPELTPQSISFKIKPASEWQNFSLDENGVAPFQAQPDWAGLNLVSNQPKGTLQLVIGFKAKRLSSTSISYQELMGLIPQFKEALAALAQMQDQPAPEINGLTIQLPEGSGATVNILSAKRKTTLKSSSAGLVIMKYKKALWDENPPVEFDELPIGIVPLQ